MKNINNSVRNWLSVLYELPVETFFPHRGINETEYLNRWHSVAPSSPLLLDIVIPTQHISAV